MKPRIHEGLRYKVYAWIWTRFFTLLSCLWLVAAIGATFPFWHGWPESFSGLEWLCGLLIALELGFIALAVVFRRTEQPP